jgi:hypothetical protein
MGSAIKCSIIVKTGRSSSFRILLRQKEIEKTSIYGITNGATGDKY